VATEVSLREVSHRAVLFDLFDTLCRIDEEAYHRGKREEARLLGLDYEPFFKAWLGTAGAAQIGQIPDTAARVRNAVSTLGRSIQAETLHAIVTLEERTLRESTSLYPDVLPALEALRGLRLGLVSNASSVAAMLLESLGLSSYFDSVTFSFRLGVAKPDPEIYLAACRSLDVEPETCLFVGDGNGRELDGAKRVGMKAVRIERPVSLGPYRQEESEQFDASIETLTRIPALLHP
jgi:putative hydrolase of the HAD superfamily